MVAVLLLGGGVCSGRNINVAEALAILKDMKVMFKSGRRKCIVNSCDRLETYPRLMSQFKSWHVELYQKVYAEAPPVCSRLNDQDFAALVSMLPAFSIDSRQLLKRFGIWKLELTSCFHF